MGTRADFYMGTGEDAKWLGSVGWDGYEWAENPECQLMQAKTPDEYMAALKEIAGKRDDWTSPEQGWPWPWDNSHTTDYAYAFADSEVKVFPWGEGADWPDMTYAKNVTIGRRSGLIVLR